MKNKRQPIKGFPIFAVAILHNLAVIFVATKRFDNAMDIIVKLSCAVTLFYIVVLWFYNRKSKE